eukprot:gnl/MRDRNA2_/MRDRNA2_108993_c0_seq1.p1 gnl/MRDRNA2_/MRDRNA2_108993_c0~~gnl/MRDRNA2_/MRDRNA2_108993_c0_seq1.p1  ORF type:complete len:279 (+),score=48.41 gnl/MRDRNA2_/MRDRNA2_108993_c0_seq1:198-1034(+)
MTGQVPEQIPVHTRHKSTSKKASVSSAEQELQLHGVAVELWEQANPACSARPRLGTPTSVNPHTDSWADDNLPFKDAESEADDDSITMSPMMSPKCMHPTQPATPVHPVTPVVQVARPENLVDVSNSSNEATVLTLSVPDGEGLESPLQMPATPNPEHITLAWPITTKDVIAARTERFARVGSRGIYRRGVPPRQPAPMYSLCHHLELADPASLVAEAHVFTGQISPRKAKPCRPMAVFKIRMPFSRSRAPPAPVDFSEIDHRLVQSKAKKLGRVTPR